MFTELRIDSFKSFATPQYAPLAPLTLIYGPNSGGKSSIIQSLLLIRQSLVSSRSSRNTLDFNGYLIDLGDFQNVAHKHGRSALKLGFSFDANLLSQPLLTPQNYERSIDFEFGPMEEGRNKGRKHHYVGLRNCTFALKGREQSNIASGFQFSLQNADEKARERGLRHDRDRERHFFRASSPSQINQVVQYLLQYYGQQFGMVEPNRSQSSRIKIASHTRRRVLEKLLSDSLFSTNDFLPSTLYPNSGASEEVLLDTNDEYVRQRHLAERYGLRLDFLARFSDEIRILLDQVSYIGPFRSPPERIEVLRDRETSTVGRAGEYLQYMISGRDPHSHLVNLWLQKLGVPYSLELLHAIVADKGALVGRVVQIRYQDNRSGTKVSATDIGYGIGQIIPIIVEGVLSENRAIFVEQPELHLHPKLQADFADLLIETAHSASNPKGNQWIIETHSELILLRILRRMRTGKLDSRQVKILYVDPPTTENSQPSGSQIFDLELSTDGRFLVPWPRGFFDEQAAEIMGNS